MTPRLKLFIPGPTEVAPEILQEMSRGPISHRGEECARLWARARHGLGRLMRTEEEVLILTGPASAMMEAGIRNLVRRRSLHLVCGAFSRRWFEMARDCGREAEALEVEWGRGFRPEQVAEAVGGGDFGAVTMVHNETSTGVMNPVAEIAAAVRSANPETLVLVDTVSSLGGAPVEVDTWGLDLCLAGVQKCLALPAGLAVAAVSARALEKAATVEGRGWFLDFVRLAARNEKEQSPTTPSTAHLYALCAQLDRILAAGLEARWARHRAMAERCRGWALEQGWSLFAEEGFRSDTVTCMARGGGPDFVPALERLKAEGYLVSNGYGPLKNKTFRIGHMGEHDLAGLDDLLDRFEKALAATAVEGRR